MQNLEYTLNDYIVGKENVISMATFLELYNEIKLGENSDFSINTNEYDNKISYEIIKNSDNLTNLDYDFLSDISKLSVIVDKEKNTFLEYVIYNINEEMCIDIMYDEFSFEY